MSANSAGTAASIASVLARRPRALAKSRTRRGSATPSKRPARDRWATALASYPPVASRTMRVGARGASQSARAWQPSSVLGNWRAVPSGRTCTSRVSLDTSMPTNRAGVGVMGTLRYGIPLRRSPSRPMRPRGSGNCSGWATEGSAGVPARPRHRVPEGHRTHRPRDPHEQLAELVKNTIPGPTSLRCQQEAPHLLDLWVVSVVRANGVEGVRRGGMGDSVVSTTERV